MWGPRWPGELGKPSVEDLGHQLGASVGVQVEAAFGDADRFGDVVHGQALATSLHKEFRDGLEDGVLPPLPHPLLEPRYRVR